MRASDLLFLVTIAAIPIQLGKFFWQQSSYVLGVPIDLLAATLYFSDLILIIYLIFFIAENYRLIPKILVRCRNFLYAAILLNIYLIYNAIFISQSADLSYWASARFFFLSIFALFASVSLSKILVYKLSFSVIAFSLSWQSVLIIWQFISQKSLGLWILGERSFDASTVGIAHAQILGRQLLRPYGTFPHPNVVAAFIVISLIILILIPEKAKPKITKLKILSVVIALFATFLTYSKSALAILLLLGVFSQRKITNLIVGMSASLAILFIFLRSVSDFQLASVAERIDLMQAALKITAKNPLFGVGSGTFIIELAKLNLFSIGEVRLLQPVHNVFLLILAENGLVGLFLFLLLLAVVLKNASNFWKIALFTAILVFASVDHFLWTLHQGRLLFWLAISFILSSPNWGVGETGKSESQLLGKF